MSVRLCVLAVLNLERKTFSSVQCSDAPTLTDKKEVGCTAFAHCCLLAVSSKASAVICRKVKPLQFKFLLCFIQPLVQYWLLLYFNNIMGFFVVGM